MKILITLIFLNVLSYSLSAQKEVTLEIPEKIPEYEIAEFILRINSPAFANPFTDAEMKGIFKSGDINVTVTGFCDSQDGTIFRLRFSPEVKSTIYNYEITFKGGGYDERFAGVLVSTTPTGKGPVIVDPLHPKHFIYKESADPFYHLGYTAYNLVDPSNDDSQIEKTVTYLHENGFNKVRFLLTGYPRDFDNRSSTDVDHGVPVDPWKSLNYGALAGRVNPLPAWLGKPHKYDFERFNVEYWQRVDKTVRLLREKGIIATCIIIIEKQDLPKEIGRFTENEYRLYEYATARLAAFDNVWWDLGNEHNEFRDAGWGNKMGAFVKENDPYNRLASAHAYADFFYNDSPWADYIITQQYGDVDSVHNWTLKYYDIRKPYVNEEYGYEGSTDKPIGHGMNSDWVRRCHWAIAMAGGYATYGDWSNGTSYFYMGFPGPGKAVVQLRHLKSFFEALPFNEVKPADNLTSKGYCLSVPKGMLIVYLPEGGTSEIDLGPFEKRRITARWFDPRNGLWGDDLTLLNEKNTVSSPTNDDWVLLIGNDKIVKQQIRKDTKN